MRVWLVSIGERPIGSTNPPERTGRMGLLAEALVRRGNHVVWWGSSFDHAHKAHVTPAGLRYRVNANFDVILTEAAGYARNISVQRLAFNRATAREFSRLASREVVPDVILTSYPPIELVSTIAGFGQAHGVPTIADVRDLWPDVWLEAAPKIARPLARLVLHPYFSLSRTSLASMTAITGITDEFVTWALARAKRPHSPRDQAFPLGYSMPDIASDERAVANKFWDKFLPSPTRPLVRLCFFGKMGERIGLDHVLEAITSLPPAAKAHIQLVICGVDMRQTTTTPIDDPAIVFAGWVDQAKLLTLMERSDLGVIPYPNTADFQGSLSNKTIEYLAGGLALTTRLEGKLKRLILNNDCGYIYDDAAAPTAFRSLLLDVLADRETLRRRKQAAFALYQSQFRAEGTYTAFADYIERIARSR